MTIRDRLRVLQPNDPDSYYASRELVPNDMLRDLGRAKIVVTNYHAFLRRETLPLSKGGRALLQGPGPELRTKESEGQMLQRVMRGLMGMKRILALNDEAHHCHREKPAEEGEESPLKGDDRKEAERNREAARVWIAGLEAVQRQLGLERVIDLSATPFFLRGSGTARECCSPGSRTRWGDRSVASFPSRCSPRAGTPGPSPTCSASAPSARNSLASRSSAGRCAASRTTPTTMASST